MTCALDRLTPRQRAIVAEAYRRQLAPLRIDIDAMALRLVGVDDATARVIVAELARSLTSRLGQVYRHPPRAACEMFPPFSASLCGMKSRSKRARAAESESTSAGIAAARRSLRKNSSGR